MTTAEDLTYIKDHMQIDTATTSEAEAIKLLRANEINTTSWVLSTLEQHYGSEFGKAYRQSIADNTCAHGFIGNCHYCKFGTE